MFTDEFERTLLEQHSRSQSLQAWAQQVKDAQRDPQPMSNRVLKPVGKRLIEFGIRLTERFGVPA